MKTNFLKLLIACLPLAAFSQKFTVSKSERVKYYVLTDMIDKGQTNSTYFNVVVDPTGIRLDVYDKTTLKLKNSTTYNPVTNESNPTIDVKKAVGFKNCIYVFFTLSSNTYSITGMNTQYGYYFQRFDENGKVDGSKGSIGEFIYACDAHLIADSSKLLVFNVGEDIRGKKQIEEECTGENLNNFFFAQKIDTIKAFIFDENKTFKKIETPGLKRNYMYNYTSWDDFVSVLCVNREFKQEKGKSAVWLNIITANFTTKMRTEVKLDFPGKSIQDANITYDKNSKKIIVSGFYTNLTPKSTMGKDIDGLLVVELNGVTGESISQKTIPISKEDVATINETPVEKVKDDKGISKFYTTKYIQNWDDGTITMIAELRYRKCNSDQTDMAEKVLIFTIPSSKTSCKVNILDKIQVNRYKFTSIFPFEKNGKLYIMYNDHPENLKVSASGAMKLTDPSLGILVAAEISKDGSFIKQKICDNSGDDIYITKGENFPDGTLIFPVETDVPYIKSFTPSDHKGKMILK